MFITLAEGSFVTAFLKAFLEAYPIPADIATRASAFLTFSTSLFSDIFIITPYSICILLSSFTFAGGVSSSLFTYPDGLITPFGNAALKASLPWYRTRAEPTNIDAFRKVSNSGVGWVWLSRCCPCASSLSFASLASLFFLAKAFPTATFLGSFLVGGDVGSTGAVICLTGALFSTILFNVFLFFMRLATTYWNVLANVSNCFQYANKITILFCDLWTLPANRPLEKPVFQQLLF